MSGDAGLHGSASSFRSRSAGYRSDDVRDAAIELEELVISEPCTTTEDTFEEEFAATQRIAPIIVTKNVRVIRVDDRAEVGIGQQLPCCVYNGVVVTLVEHVIWSPGLGRAHDPLCIGCIESAD